jgi:prepilin-type processing-associated H-X9-DG protein
VNGRGFYISSHFMVAGGDPYNSTIGSVPYSYILSVWRKANVAMGDGSVQVALSGSTNEDSAANAADWGVLKYNAQFSTLLNFRPGEYRKFHEGTGEYPNPFQGCGID